MPSVQEAGEHAHARAAVQALGDAEQLQHEPELLRVVEVVGLDLLDAVERDVIELHGGMEREPREDRHLGGGILPVHVLGRVGLGVTQLLRAGECVGVRRAGAGHLGEDVVGRAVHDAVHLLDVRARERLAHHAHDGDHAGHRRLVAKLRAARAGGGEQLVAVLGEQLLVRRHERLAGLERAQRVLAGRLDAADQLDDRVRGGEDLVERPAGPGQDAGDLRPSADGRLDRACTVRQQRREGRPHRAVTQQAHAEWRGRHVSRAARSSYVSRRTTTRASPSLQKITGGRGTPL